LTKRFLSALASAVVTKKMINTPSMKVRPEVQLLIVVLAASLGSAGSVRRHLSNLGDWPRGEKSPAGIG
jgi:hypothetical protein